MQTKIVKKSGVHLNLATLRPGKKPEIAIVARESHGLHAIYCLINKVEEVESLLDQGLKSFQWQDL